MNKRSVITSTQLFSMFFISRTMISLIYCQMSSPSNVIWEWAWSAVISFILTFIFIMPIYFNYKMYPNDDIIDISSKFIGKLSILIAMIYIFYYLYICSYTLSMFDILMSNFLNPNISLILLSVSIVLTSCYGAYKGIESLARTSAIFVVIIIISMSFICVGLIPKMDLINLYSVNNNVSEICSGIFFIMSRMSCVPGMAMAIPFAKGDVKKGILFWNVSTFLIIIIVITMITGTLGDYVKTQMFPVYTATSIAQIGILKRLDAFYFGIWTSGIFIKLSLYMFLTSVCITKIFGEKFHKIGIIASGVIISVMSILVAKSRSISNIMYDSNILFVLTMTTSFILPLIFLILSKMKGKSRYESAK